MEITTIGLDIAKNGFQVRGFDVKEKVVVRKQLRRSQMIAFFTALPPCLIGIEACATAHYWARELKKLGHEVGLMPAKDVKAYVKRKKKRCRRRRGNLRSGSAPDHALRADKVGRTAGSVNAAPHARSGDTPAHPDHKRLAGASGRTRHRGGAGNAGANELHAIVADEQDTRLPIDARANVIVLAARLEALRGRPRGFAYGM
jgi:transposase